MSVAARNWADRCTTGSKTAKAVLVVLANAAKDKLIVGGRGTAHQCWLSQATIAQRAECSVPSVQRALRTLNLKGFVLSRFGSDRRGYRTFSEFYLNVNVEPIDCFAERCSIAWRAMASKHQSDGKAGKRLDINGSTPIHHRDVASTLNRELNRERAPSKGRSRSTELPKDWMLSEDERRDVRAEFDATDEEIERLARRFQNHYWNIAKPKDRRRENWFAQFRQWCLEDLPMRKGSGQADIEEGFTDDAWCTHVKFWVEHNIWNDGIGPAPDKAGCRVPKRILDQFGLGRARPAAA